MTQPDHVPSPTVGEIERAMAESGFIMSESQVYQSLNYLLAEVARLTAQLAEVTGQRDYWQEAFDGMVQRGNTLHAQLDSLRAQLAHVNAAIEKTWRPEVSALCARLKAQEAVIQAAWGLRTAIEMQEEHETTCHDSPCAPCEALAGNTAIEEVGLWAALDSITGHADAQAEIARLKGV